MVTRWSRAHDELYLRQKRDDGVVADVEELTVVLWLGGIGQRRSVEWVWLGGCHGVLVTALAWKRTTEGEMARGRGSERGAGLAFIWEHGRAMWRC